MTDFGKKYSGLMIGAVLALLMLLPYQVAVAGGLEDADIMWQVVGEDEGGTRIIGANCDPMADPAKDADPRTACSTADPNIPCKRSCIGEGITMDDYRIIIHSDPSAFPDACTNNFGVSDSGFCKMMTIPAWTPPLMLPVDITVGSGTYFTNYLIGDMVCVYGSVFPGGPIYGIAVKDSYIDPKEVDPGFQKSLPGVFSGDVNGRVHPTIKGMPWNCMPVPPPLPDVKKAVWNNIISKACTEFKTDLSQYRFADVPAPPSSPPGTPATAGKSRSFSGVAVRCIEETMENIFTLPDANDTQTPKRSYFEKVQDAMIGTIRLLLTMYIIFLGYKVILDKQLMGRKEFIWIGLRITLVLYFAAGPGLQQIGPMLHMSSKSLSLLVMESIAGSPADALAARDQLDVKEKDFDIANNDLAQKRRDLAADPTNTTKQGLVAAAVTVRSDALDLVNKTRIDADSMGYRYCDFRDLEVLPAPLGNPAIYMPGGVDHTDMKLWDMMDCKVSKYLGVGDNISAPDQPQILVIAVAAVFSHILGAIIFIATILVLIYLMMVVVRVIHIYIISTIAISLLLFIGPLIIPTVLFQYTKSTFDKWMSSLLAYVMQPVIMFTFLGFLFSAFDMVIYDGNHHFIPMTLAHSGDENKVCMTLADSPLLVVDSPGAALCDAGELLNVNYDDVKCDDPNAPGCITQRMSIGVKEGSMGARKYTLNMDFNEGLLYILGLLKLILICVISFSVMTLVEQLSVTLVNAVGGGAAGMSASPMRSPVQMAQSMAKVGKSGVNALKGMGKSGGDAKKRDGLATKGKDDTSNKAKKVSSDERTQQKQSGGEDANN